MRKLIGQILIENGSISEDQLNIALRIQNREHAGHLGAILIMLGYVSTEQLLRCLDEQRD